MNKLSYLGYFMFFFIISFFSFGQVGLGQWREHLPYTIGQKVIVAKDDVYMVTSLGLMKYGKKTKEIEKITKISELNDSDIRGIAYNPELEYLFLGYANGNIDIITNNSVINNSDIKRKSMNTDKSIYTIEFSDNKAYLGCGFGIVVLDILKNEIKETWYLGNNGGYVKVNSLEIKDNIIYAATDIGIYKGDLSTTLLDNTNWEIISDNHSLNPSFQWMSGKSFNNMIYFDDKLIVNYYDNINSNSDTILVYDGQGWSYFGNYPYHSVQSITCDDNNIILCNKSANIVFFNKDLSIERDIWGYRFYDGTEAGINAQNAVLDTYNPGILWIADNSLGLVSYYLQNWTSENYRINGPLSSNIFDMDSHGEDVYCVGGGMNLSWAPLWYSPDFYIFSNQTWKSYTTQNVPEMGGFADLVRIAVDPNDPKHFFCGSWVRGILEFRNNVFYKSYDSENSTLKKVGASDDIRIGGLTFDKKGNLWVTNSLTNPNIHMMTPEGRWYSFDYPGMVNNSSNVSKILITKDNIKWVILPNGNGIFVFDENGTPDDMNDDKSRRLSVVDGEGLIINNDIYSLAEDKNGYIWVGTSKGVAVYERPEDVFTSNITARRIKIPRNDGTNDADLLLENEIVTAINVDGANKKWFGTRSSGAFYTSEDGLEEYYHFTTENSPLLDNNILCLTVAPKSGEVFFGTGKGIMSFRNLATEGKENYTEVYAFPNPVREDYDGPITITGLVAGSYVKITDIAGNLVYEVRSDGGQAEWYGKDMSGHKVKTGIYLVFLTNETGSKTDVTKIMVIN